LVQKLSTFRFNNIVLQVHSKGKTKMRSITLIILHGFIAQVAAKDVANQGISDEDLKALQDIDMDKFVDTLKTKLVDRLMQHLGDMDSTDNVDSTTLGKAHADAGMPTKAGFMAPGMIMGKQTTNMFVGNKGMPIHPERMPPAQSMQAYSPIDAKKAETLSYLPQLSNPEIEKQISYMIRNGWTPALEMSEDGDVYLNTRMGPGYYDNRYWSQYKLPMFGCTDPYQVVAEIENCKREYPTAKVRVIAYDSVKQVQAAAFMVRN